jgi:hypothetical protein
VESAIAASVVLAALNNLRPAVLGARWAVAFGFGLVHGFGFASVLREFGLPREALGWSLFGFNLGVELGQLTFVLPVAALLGAVRRRSPLAGSRLAMVGSVIVALAGTYWFVQRVFFSGV